jgi:Ca2+/Na+ antiporter
MTFNLINHPITVIDAVFLLFLAIGGNFIAETLGCRTQDLLINNIYAKHFLTFFVIFFTINFSSDENKIEHPINNIFKTVAVYLFFLLFTKMGWKSTVFTVFLLLSVYVLNLFKNYYKNIFNNEKNKTKTHEKKFIDLHTNINKMQGFLLLLISITVIVGFTLYFKEKHKEYDKKFNIFKFIFGVTKCRRLA